MTAVYGENYYLDYILGQSNAAYPELRGFFVGIAERIIQDFAPKLVLDAGCAFGLLVEALRDRGVEAYGVDISSYAIGNVREDIRPYCRARSLLEKLPEDFPQHYDLVTNIEVLEHLHEKESLSAMAALCGLTDRILFSSTPDDIVEPTHYNVRLREYWCRHFAEHGFRHILDYTANYVSPQAMLFEKDEMEPVSLVEDYEHQVRLEIQIQTALRGRVAELEQTCSAQEERLNHSISQIDLDQAIARIESEVANVRASHSYRLGHAMLAPLRTLKAVGLSLLGSGGRGKRDSLVPRR